MPLRIAATTVTNAAAAAGRKEPSVIREIIYGLSLGAAVASVWKYHHIKLKRRYKEFYDALERGEITTVIHVVDEIPLEKTLEMIASENVTEGVSA